MEDQLLELKTCIAVYQKKYTEVVNLNIGLESKLHYLSEKIASLEKEIEEKNVKLFGNERKRTSSLSGKYDLKTHRNIE